MSAIIAAVQSDQWALTSHARRNAGQRRILDEELVQILAGGEILEDYPTDPRGPSALILGHTTTGRPLHAVCAFDPDGTLLVITTYEPTPLNWIDERRRDRTEGN